MASYSAAFHAVACTYANFVTTYVTDGFFCNWPIKYNLDVVRGGIDKCWKANMELSNSASHGCHILIGQWKPIKKLSKICHRVATDETKTLSLEVAMVDTRSP